MLQTILAIVIACIVFVFGMTAWNYSAAEMEVARARADAIRIEAKADASATVIVALIPWGIIMALGLPITILALRRQPRIIERQIMYLPALGEAAPELPRREVWRQLVEVKDKAIIEQ